MSCRSLSPLVAPDIYDPACPFTGEGLSKRISTCVLHYELVSCHNGAIEY